jgi:hypothetical protein
MKAITESDKLYINDLLLLEADDLYSLIPPLLVEYASTAFSSEGQKKAGIHEFEKRRSAIQQALCVDWNGCEKLLNRSADDKVMLIASIADAISASTIGLPPFIIATLIFKLGIRQFCNCDKQQRDEA